jgi:uroporphyrinogen-III synthase
MRILVTRPQPGADETAARLRAMGEAPLVHPLTRIVANAPPALAAAPAAIAFTSRNAVRAVAGWPGAAARRRLPVFAVGEATAAAARQAGFTDVAAADGDVARLAALIRRRFVPSSGALLYPAGRDRAGDLAAALGGSAIEVLTVEAYRAEAVDHIDPAVAAALAARQIDAVLFHSRRSAEVFAGLMSVAMLQPALAGIRLLALSARVAEPLGQFAAAVLAIAETPDEAALLALVRSRLKDGRSPNDAV